MGQSQLQKLEAQRKALNKKISEQKRIDVDTCSAWSLKKHADKHMNPQYISGYAEAYIKKKRIENF